MNKSFIYSLLEKLIDKKFFSETWYNYLTGEWHSPFPPELEGFKGIMDRQRWFFSHFPNEPHCYECGKPMAGFWGRVMGSRPSSFSPRLCNSCEQGVRLFSAGAEVDLTMVFADVRDSTPLAESKGPSGFKDIINRFYKETSNVLIEHNAMVNRLMGDQVIALFAPRFVGKNHAKVALHAAQELLRETGHGDANGPWIPVGAGIHTGLAYVGAVGSPDGVNEIAVLGSAANMCARISSKAAAGEILISEDSVKSGDLDADELESRSLELKGVSQPVLVRVMKV